MSLKPSRIHHIRKPFMRRRHARLENDACPSELPRLPECRDEEETVADETASSWPDEADSRYEVPFKLRHLKVAADRGHLEAMYLLAQECDDRVSRIHWLTMAAERGHVPAMHDLGLASAALHERRRWLLHAARHGWAEALAELGDVECS